MQNDVIPEALIPEEMREKKLQIEDLKPYAKKDCKECIGRGYLKMVNIDGSFKSNDFCKCVFKSKKIKELMEKINQSIPKNDLSAV